MLPNASGKASDTDASVTLLGALAWVCGDDDRAHRFLALTGIDVAELRARATEPAILAAVGQFLADHEPDLIACADALSISPATLATAAGRLTG
jgi:hypothetical protein